MNKNPGLHPDDPHVRKALVWMTRIVWCWETFCWAVSGTGRGIAAACAWCWNLAAWSLKTAAPALALLVLASVAYAYVMAPKEDPNVLEFETEGILICQNDYVYTEENGKRERIVTQISMQHANPAIVKKFFSDYGYDVVEETGVHGYDQKSGRYRERHRSINGRSDDFLVLGKAPPFREISIHGERVRVVLDPDYVHPYEDSTWRWTVKHNMERLANAIRYDDPR